MSVEWKRLGGLWSESGKGPGQVAKSVSFLQWPNIFLLGGRRQKIGISRDVWKLNLEEKTWNKVPSLRLPLVEGTGLAVVEEDVYIFGGHFSRGSSFLSVLKKGKNDFVTVPNVGPFVPKSRRGHSFVPLGKSIFSFGGYIDLHGSTDELWRFDTQSNLWLNIQCSGPSPRHSHSAVVFDGWMWIYGGLNNLSVCGDLWRFHLENFRWESIKAFSSPPALFGHTAAVCGSKMYLMGGETSDGASQSELWSFSFNSMTWTKLSASNSIMPPAAVYSCLVSLDPDPTGGKSIQMTLRQSPEYRVFERLEDNQGDCNVCNSLIDYSAPTAHENCTPSQLSSLKPHYAKSAARSSWKINPPVKRRRTSRKDSSGRRSSVGTLNSRSYDELRVVSVKRNSTQNSADSGFVEAVRSASQDTLLRLPGRPLSIDSDIFGMNPAFEFGSEQFIPDNLEDELSEDEENSPPPPAESTAIPAGGRPIYKSQLSNSLVNLPGCVPDDFGDGNDSISVSSGQYSKLIYSDPINPFTQSETSPVPKKTTRTRVQSLGEMVELMQFPASGITKSSAITPSITRTSIDFPDHSLQQLGDEENSDDIISRKSSSRSFTCQHPDGECSRLILFGGKLENCNSAGFDELQVWQACLR